MLNFLLPLPKVKKQGNCSKLSSAWSGRPEPGGGINEISGPFVRQIS